MSVTTAVGASGLTEPLLTQLLALRPSRARAAESLPCRAMGKTLVTGASGFIGSHLARALAERGDELVLLMRRTSDANPLEGLDYARVTGDVTDRRAVRRAIDGVDRVFHAAGRTSLRAGRPRGGVRGQRQGHARWCSRRRWQPGSSGRSSRPRSPRSGRRSPTGSPTRRSTFTRGRAGHRLRQLQARGGGRGAAPGRTRPAARNRQPDVRAGSRLPRRHLDEPGPAVPAGTDLRLRRTGRSTSSTCATSPTGTCWPTRRARWPSATSSAGATSPSTASSPTSRGSRASRRPSLRLPAGRGGQRRRAGGLAQAAGARCRPTRSAPARCGGRTATPRPSASWASSRGPHEETLEDAVRWQSDQLGDRVGRGGGPSGGCSRRRRPRDGPQRPGGAAMSGGRPLPLPDPHQRALPVRRGRAAAAQARRRALDRAACPTTAGAARRSRS